MNFRTFLEASDELFKLAYSLGEMPRDQVQELVDQKRSNVDVMDDRDRFTFATNFGWSIPCKEAVDVIKKYVREPLYDVLAGTGYWAKILRKEDVNVIASDIHKITGKNYFHTKSEDDKFLDISTLIKPEKEKIIRRNALKVGYHMGAGRLVGDIFLSWPPCGESFVTDLLKMIPVGTRIFYIGEGRGGCTGDLSFHEFLKSHFKQIHHESLPTWKTIHDSLRVYEKIK